MDMFQARRVALLGLWLALAGTTQAQQYTLKTLAQPSGRLGDCFLGAFAALDDQGNVRGRCAYWTGGFYATDLPILSWFPSSRGRLVVWQANGTRTLANYPNNASVSVVLGQGANGLTYARLVKSPEGSFTSRVELGVHTFNGSTWAAWVPPSPLTGTWDIAHISSSGTVLARSTGADQPGRLAVIVGTQVRQVPPPPSIAEGDRLGLGWANAVGQVVVTTYALDGTKRWYWWDGQQWAQRTLGGLGQGEGFTAALNDLNVQGLALINALDDPQAETGKTPVRYYRWNPATDQVQAVPTFLRHNPQGFLNDAGQIAGENMPDGSPTDQYFKPRRAMVWRNGQPVDLNTLTTVPSGYLLERPLAQNNKGQILVHMSSTNGGTWQWGLLTPK